MEKTTILNTGGAKEDSGWSPVHAKPDKTSLHTIYSTQLSLIAELVGVGYMDPFMPFSSVESKNLP